MRIVVRLSPYCCLGVSEDTPLIQVSLERVSWVYLSPKPPESADRTQIDPGQYLSIHRLSYTSVLTGSAGTNEATDSSITKYFWLEWRHNVNFLIYI